MTLIGSGLISILQGESNYLNYWGGVVWAPLAIAIGIVLLFAIVFRWNKLQQQPLDKHGHKIKFPADDFEKW